MAIVTQAMVESRLAGEAELIRLTDDAGAGAVDATNLAQAISSAEGEVAGYIRRRWAWPLALTTQDVADLVRGVILSVVALRLYERRIVVPEDVRRGYEAAIKWCEAVARGEVVLDGEAASAVSPAAGGEFVVVADERVISRDDMDGL